MTSPAGPGGRAEGHARGGGHCHGFVQVLRPPRQAELTEFAKSATAGRPADEGTTQSRHLSRNCHQRRGALPASGVPIAPGPVLGGQVLAQHLVVERVTETGEVSGLREGKSALLRAAGTAAASRRGQPGCSRGRESRRPALPRQDATGHGSVDALTVESDDGSS